MGLQCCLSGSNISGVYKARVALYAATIRELTCFDRVRIEPEISLQNLREEIGVQLEDQAIPESYVFLRTLGRCLAMVIRLQLHVPPVNYSTT